MKGIIIGMACALVASLSFAQTGITDKQRPIGATEPTTTTTTQTTTTATTGTGTVTTFQPGRTIVVKEDSGPVTYTLGQNVRYVNKTGHVINGHMIKPGERVVVHYTGDAGTRTVESVQVED
jgi:hypothetical protein